MLARGHARTTMLACGRARRRAPVLTLGRSHSGRPPGRGKMSVRGPRLARGAEPSQCGAPPRSWRYAMTAPTSPLPLLPTTVVGSHARPAWWYLAEEAIRAGRFGTQDEAETLDHAVDVAILDQERLGVD